MNVQRGSTEPFTFGRGYGTVSFVAILVAALALAALYRALSIRTITEFGEQGNVTVARTALNAMIPQLFDYLRSHEAAEASAAIDSVPPGLLGLIRASVRDTPIERIKVFNRNGLVLYSTLEQEIGTRDSANPRFQMSIRGTVRSRLLYRDAFSLFGDASDDANLIETYVPIRRPGDHRPVGVLEIYTDVDTVARTMTRNELMVLAGIGATMFGLYGFLVYVVHRADRIITEHRRTILERNRTLEVISARMLQAEEAERRRVAWELHEDIAQTLSAAKARIDAATNTAALSEQRSGAIGGEEVLFLVQSAISDVRDLAMDLRPPALDDFGLIATTRSLCREAQLVAGQMGIVADLAVREEEIPELLKSVIFRITQKTLKCLVRLPEISDVRIVLRRDEGLHLSIDFSAGSVSTLCPDERVSPAGKRPIAEFWERAVLSGGSFTTSLSKAGRFHYQATWVL